jgi:hypothetical protein
MMKHLAAVCGSLLLASVGCAEVDDNTSQVNQQLTPNSAFTQWHQNAQTLVAAFTGRGNPAQAYTHALITAAMYDATVAIRGKYEPFIADVAAPNGANLDAAVATAAWRVGITRVNSNPTAVATYTAQYDAFLAAIPDGQAKTDGIAVGEAAAQAVLAARSTDNFYNTAVYTNPPPDTGVWQAKAVADAEATAGANDYQMAFVIPLTANSPGARRIGPPTDMGSRKYAESWDETREYGRKVSSVRTAAQTDVAQFWTESGFTIWTRNTRDIVIDQGLDEVDGARALAMIGVAAGDGMLACWDAKYHYMWWRPWQSIPRADEDGNRRTTPEAGWIPLVRANHPEYPAGHGCYGGAMAAALEKVFEDEFPFTLTSTGNQVTGWPVIPSRNYQRWSDITADNANARVWGGLHYRTTMNDSSKWEKKLVKDALRGHFKRAKHGHHGHYHDGGCGHEDDHDND